MPNRKLLAAALFLPLIIILSACSFGVTLDEMLSPPKLTDEQSEIYQALVKSKGAGFRLKYPKSGDYRSAFVVYDFDGEPTDEAIVFYEIEGINSERALWLNFLDQDENHEWESVYDLAVSGTEIERIIFANLGNDDKTSIIVCYSVSQSEKSFTLIQYSDKTPERILSDNYTYLEVDDYFNEGRELFVIKTDHTVETSTALFYSAADGSLSISRSCGLNPDAYEYTGVTKGFIDEKTEAIIINYRKNDTSRSLYGTDVLVMRSGTLVNPILKNAENIDLVTRRVNSSTELANPCDIDGDGFIEFCSTTAFPGHSSRAIADRVHATVWMSLSYNTLEKKYYSYYNGKNGFVFIMPNRWQNEVTATVSLDGNRVSFYVAEKSVEDATIQLLSIRTIQDGLEAANLEGWNLYAVNPKKKVRYYIRSEYPENILALTEDEMKYGFRLLE